METNNHPNHKSQEANNCPETADREVADGREDPTTNTEDQEVTTEKLPAVTTKKVTNGGTPTTTKQE